MKNFTKFLTIAILGLAFSASTFAQDTETATATAVIVTPITLSHDAELVFGNIAPSAAPGTVTIPAAAAPVRTSLGGVTLIGGITPTAAHFTATGQASTTFSITLPADGSTTISNGAQTMGVNFTTPTLTGLAIGGSFYVGGILSVAATQATGTYTGNFNVTVQYE